MQDTKVELNPEVMNRLMIFKAIALFYDPKISFDEAVQKLASDFACPRAVAEDCMGYVVEDMSKRAIRNAKGRVQ